MIREPNMTFGCDPEFFFLKNGKAIGAEKVIPPSGLDTPHRLHAHILKKESVVLDGVQAELHANASFSRARVACEMAATFDMLKRFLRTRPDVKITWNTMVDIEKDELMSLVPKSREFGCQPSLNIYDDTARVGVKGDEYFKRMAGGHIHLGLNTTQLFTGSEDHRARLVPLLDIFVGNTAVMLDQEDREGSIERRKHYGRAGEYRLPVYGLEYRTLSNFWLRSNHLMSGMMGLVRLAAGVLNETVTYNNNLEDWLVQNIDIEKVVTAINTNDPALARENFNIVKEFIMLHGTNQNSGLCPALLKPFEYFVKMVQLEGMSHWFPEDVLSDWADMPEIYVDNVWERFLADIDVPE